MLLILRESLERFRDALPAPAPPRSAPRAPTRRGGDKGAQARAGLRHRGMWPVPASSCSAPASSPRRSDDAPPPARPRRRDRLHRRRWQAATTAPRGSRDPSDCVPARAARRPLDHGARSRSTPSARGDRRGRSRARTRAVAAPRSAACSPASTRERRAGRVQQIEVSLRLQRRRKAQEPIARREQWHVEALAVERHEVRRVGEPPPRVFEHRGLAPEPGQEVLPQAQTLGFGTCEAQHERQRAGAPASPVVSVSRNSRSQGRTGWPSFST